IALAIPLVLAACGNPNSQSETPSTTQQIPSETTTSSITTSSTVPTSTESTTAQHPIIEESTAQAEATEPYVVECLFGTPGPHSCRMAQQFTRTIASTKMEGQSTFSRKAGRTVLIIPHLLKNMLRKND